MSVFFKWPWQAIFSQWACWEAYITILLTIFANFLHARENPDDRILLTHMQPEHTYIVSHNAVRSAASFIASMAFELEAISIVF